MFSKILTEKLKEIEKNVNGKENEDISRFQYHILSDFIANI